MTNITYDSRNTFIKGNQIILSILTKDDVYNSNWYGWFNDEETTLNIQKHYFPNTIENQLNFLSGLENDQSKIQLGIRKIEDPDKLIGVISLQSIDFINSNAEISLVVGENESRDLMVADEAIKLLINHAFYTLNLHKINVGFLESLTSWGEFLMKRFAFKREGILKEQVFKNGRFMDSHLIGLIKSDYKIDPSK